MAGTGVCGAGGGRFFPWWVLAFLGFPLGGWLEIVVVGYILWSVWLALFGILLLLPRSIRHRARLANPAGKATTRIEGVAGVDRGR